MQRTESGPMGSRGSHGILSQILRRLVGIIFSIPRCLLSSVAMLVLSRAHIDSTRKVDTGTVLFRVLGPATYVGRRYDAYSRRRCYNAVT